MLNVISGLLAGGVAASTNSYESISTVTVGAGGASSISFSSIPSTFKHLQIRAIGRFTDTSGVSSLDFNWRVNGDSGANYSRHRLYGTGSGTGSSGASSQTFAGSEIGIIPSSSYTAGVFGALVLDVLDYANTSKAKTFRLLGGIDGNTNDTNGRISLDSSAWYSNSAITQLDFYVGTIGSFTFSQYTQIALYGIKG